MREITGGEGRRGGSTASARTPSPLRSTACALGMLVTYGNASGPVPPFDPIPAPSQKGSLFVTRPTLMTYTAQQRADLAALGTELFAVVAAGQVRIEVNQPTYALKDAARPIATSSPQNHGFTILLPERPGHHRLTHSRRLFATACRPRDFPGGPGRRFVIA